MKLKNFIIILLIVASITSCAPILIGGATATGVAIMDRRSTGAIADDNAMEFNISTKANNFIKNIKNDNYKNDISVLSYNRNILLLGHVKNIYIATEIERIAKSQIAARNVYNYITIEGDRSFQGLASDAWITSKIRTMMIKPKGFYPNNVKIKTYAGVTYVMGILTPKEQQAVNNFISTIPGVKKVITLYEGYDS